jgi:hypothetical protein
MEKLAPAKVSSDDLYEHFKDDPEKINIISKLPEDFPEQVIKYVEECKKTSREFDFKKETRGRVFEVLVKEQFLDDEETALETKISDEIQELISDPRKYKLREYLELGRIPDIARVKVKEDGLVTINGAIEAKATKYLNKRAWKQLKEGSFLNTFRKLTRTLSKLSGKSLSKRGLKILGGVRSSGNFFTVSDKFKPTLVLPADVRTVRGSEKDLISSREFFAHERDKFANDLKKIDIKNSYFSNDDVTLISNFIMERM